MKYITVPAAAVFAAALGVNALRAQSLPAVSVLRDPGCGCCLSWVSHLSKAGFKVTVAESNNMSAEKDRRGVPAATRSCHTATVGNYVIEGHVPAADIKRLLDTHPDVAGLAVPGMPVGSPGMESGDGRKAPFDVVAFDKTGKTRVFASYR